RFVDDDSEISATVLIADFVENERELLDRGDNDFLPALDKFTEVTGMLSVADRCTYLSKLFDGGLNLLVEDAAVGDDNDRVKNLLIVFAQTDELMPEPGNGVRLAATGGVLDEVALASIFREDVGEQLAHDIELMIAGEYLGQLLFPGFRILVFNDLGVIFDDVRDAC